jgi:23S rRNA pseudouridine2605 synthase
LRLAKYLAHAGIASRRQAEVLITQGRVRINGCVVREAATKVDPQSDCIEFDGHSVVEEDPVYILLYKPAGFISTVYDPQGRSTVLELAAEVKERIYPVGRLDYDTEGILLLTNDGQFSNLIIHPRYKIDKKYQAWVTGFIKDDELRTLREGVELEDGVTAPADVHVIERDDRTSMIEMTIHEGRKRQVKRMCAAVGHPVISLQRTGVGVLTLEGLDKGQYRFLRQEEVELLKAMAENESQSPQV